MPFKKPGSPRGRSATKRKGEDTGHAPKRGRNSGRGRGRGRPGRQSEGQEDSEDVPQGRRHVLIEDEDEDDAQRAYEEEGGTYLEDIYIPPGFQEPVLEDSTERLVIEKITCINFKSYGGIKVMGPFHKSFSSIVGPNGNGKSNIIDAMLFVFGYRAAKIRCKKLSVLIHKSELLPNLPACSVSVHFQKILDNGEMDDSYNVIPNSQITVTRKARKDNSSSYWLNKEKVKFQDVAIFLKNNGIDIVHNRFLILQGEVESISQMPPKQTPSSETGLLEFLEDIIGSRRYLRSLVKLEDRVESLNQIRLERLQIVDLVERERKSLDEPAKKAKDYLALLNTKTRNEYHVSQFKVHEKEEQLKEIEEKKTAVDQSVQDVVTRLAEIGATNKVRKKDFEKAENEHKQLDSEYKKKKKALDTADAEYTKSTEQLQRANEQRKKVIKDTTKKEEELEKLDEIPVSHESEIEKLGQRKVELEEQVEKEQVVADKECGKLQTKTSNIVAEKALLERDYLDKKKIRDKNRREVDSLASDLKLYKGQEQVEREKFEVIKSEVEQLREALKEKEKSSRKSLENNNLEPTLNEKTTEFQQLTSLEKVKKADLDKMQDSIEEMKSALDGSHENDALYKLFWKEKEQGKLGGLYGRLKDLATIDEKYNVAISTAAGGMLEFWVCDNDNTGSACIQILKSNDVSSQSFICLTRVGANDKKNINVPFKAPTGSQRLFDLLNVPKPEVRLAFYKALKNTLVADNIDTATKIAYGEGVDRTRRVVTLKGELIDSSGAMVGGGRPQAGKMNSRMASSLGSSFTPAQLKDLKQKYEIASKEYEELCSRRRNLDQEIRKIMADIKHKKLMAQNFMNDLNSMKHQLPFKETRLVEQEARLKVCLLDPKILKEKEKGIEKAQAQLDESEIPLEKAEAEVSKMAEKLKEIEAEKKQFRKKLEKLLDMKKKVEAELSKFTIELKNYKKNRIKVIEKISSLKNEKEKLQKQMETTNEAKKKIEADALKIKEDLVGLETQVQESGEKLKELKENANEFREEENKLNKDKVKLDNELKNINATCEKIIASVRHLHELAAGLELKQIPGEVIEPLQPLTEEELENFDVKDVEKQISDLKHKLGKEEPNLEILDVYQQKWNEFYKVVDDLKEVTERRDKFRDAYLKTMGERLSEFMHGFAIISTKVKELFRMISMGGDAELEILDSYDPFTCGIDFTVRPARKTWKQISYLSGGEKTLSSLALVFALHYYKPSPFYVMDEIDAALDFKNVSIIANYIKERTKFTQFIIISLRSNMFELADSLLGVYKVDNMSYSIHLGVGRLIEQLKKKYQEMGKEFPLVSEYCHAIGKKKNPEISRSPELFPDSEVTAIPAITAPPAPASTTSLDVSTENIIAENGAGTETNAETEAMQVDEVGEVDTTSSSDTYASANSSPV